MDEPRRNGPGQRRSERMLTGLSRFMVWLMWAILLAVVVSVAYLANRFYG